MATLWASPVCGTCQTHFTPWLPAWPFPVAHPTASCKIYRPSEPRWFPVIAARGIIMNTHLPACSWMRFGRIFTAGSKTLLQSSSLSQGLGHIAVEPHGLLLQAARRPRPTQHARELALSPLSYKAVWLIVTNNHCIPETPDSCSHS